ncbi:MAG TPA: type IV secretion system protein [Coxiellaceae bacterium]|nr:type IV secretion system protein [Coxiellaceae bacterium]
MQTNMIDHLLTSVDTQVNHLIFDAYHQVLSSLSFTLTLLLAIYFAGLGWLVIRGLLPLAPMAIAWHIFKVVLIWALALHWDYFSSVVVNSFVHGTDHLVGAILGGIKSGNTTQTITDGLAHLWQTGINVFADVWRSSGPDFLLGNLMGFLGYGIVLLITATALFYILMTKIALSVLLILAPLMMPFFLWESTRQIFHSWLQLLVKWAIVPLFIYTFVAMYLDLLQAQINDMLALAEGPTTASISLFVLLGLIAAATFKQAGTMSSAIAKRVSWEDKSDRQWFSVPSAVFKVWREKI